MRYGIALLLSLFLGLAACVGTGPQLSITRENGIPAGDQPGGSPSGEPGTSPASSLVPMQLMGGGMVPYESARFHGFGGNNSVSGAASKSSRFEMKSPGIVLGQDLGASQ